MEKRPALPPGVASIVARENLVEMGIHVVFAAVGAPARVRGGLGITKAGGRHGLKLGDAQPASDVGGERAIGEAEGRITSWNQRDDVGVLRGAPHHGRFAIRQRHNERIVLVGVDHGHDLRLDADRNVAGGQAVEKIEGGRVGRDEAVFRCRRRRR